MKRPYDDIIHLPHHVSKKHPQMPAADRAAQFSPFAALTGYEDAIRETARQTMERPELDESEKAELDRKLAILKNAAAWKRNIGLVRLSVTYFAVDGEKAGGSIVTTRGFLKNIDDHRRCLVMLDGKDIFFEDIMRMESMLFDELI